MDFNTIYKLVAPYLGTTGIAGILIATAMLVIKYRKVMAKIESTINTFISNMKLKFENTENEALKAFKSALPKDLFINIESLAKSELSAIKEEIWATIDERWLGQMTKNTELTQAIATALLGNKTIADSDKETIANLLKIKNSNTTKNLKVELLATKEESAESESNSNVSNTKVLID